MSLQAYLQQHFGLNQPMQRLTLGQRLFAAIIEPRQVMLLNGQSGNPARNLNVRPITILVILLALPALTLLIGLYYAPLEGTRNIIPQHMQLQRKYNDLQNKYSDLQAMSEIKELQIESLKAEIMQQRDQTEIITQRLLMLENILESKKASGVQLLKFNARWSSSTQINYHFTLVKGGNYSRRVTGEIMVTTQDPEGNIVTLQLEESQSNLPYRMKSHTFLNGYVTWNKTWKPKQLLAIIYNRKGKEIIQKEIVIEGASL